MYRGPQLRPVAVSLREGDRAQCFPMLVEDGDKHPREHCRDNIASSLADADGERVDDLIEASGSSGGSFYANGKFRSTED